MAKTVTVGLIGAGFIGESHARALRMMPSVFQDAPLHPVPYMLAEQSLELAEAKAAKLGFTKGVANWQETVAACDAVIIAVPSVLHKEIALATIDQGKALLCEKPVGLSAAETAEIGEAARNAQVGTAVGFTYMRAPLIRHAQNVITSGALGRPVHFRGWHAEDYLADPNAPYSWRLDPAIAGPAGALGDLGWHILSLARALCGSVTSLTGAVETVYRDRPLPDDPATRRAVGNEDWAAMTLTFATGAAGQISCSRIAHGRKMDIGFELTCEGGTIAFHGERMNELQIFRAGDAGFQRILCDAGHPDYGAFIPAPGHGLGFNDLKVIEIRDFMEAVASRRGAAPDLDTALSIARICEAALYSSSTGQRVEDPEAR